jgi:hypothetical protein
VVSGDGADIDTDHIEALPDELRGLDEASLADLEDQGLDEDDDKATR